MSQLVRLNVFRSHDDIARQCGKVGLLETVIVLCTYSYTDLCVWTVNLRICVFALVSPQVVVSSSDLKETLRSVSESYGEAVIALKTPRGAVISDVSVLRCVVNSKHIVDLFCICCFSPPSQRLGHCDCHNRWSVHQQTCVTVMPSNAFPH